MTFVLWVLAIVGALRLQRAIVAARKEAAFRAKFPVDERGIIVGAHARTYEADTNRAILLIHGWNDSPQSLDGIAQRLHAAGWTVRLPLMPGHGRSLRAFDSWTAAQVFAAVREEYAALKATHRTVVVGGLSMGGALATWLAAEADPDGVVLYAPMLFIPRTMEWGVATARLWSFVARYLSGKGRSVMDQAAANRLIAYRVSSRRSLEALEAIAHAVVVRLGFVHAPVLIIQSDADNRLPRDQSNHAHARIGSADRSVIWTTGAGHVLTVDYGWEQVAQRTVEWLSRFR